MVNEHIESREVSWKVYGIDVYGTLTSPKNDAMHPAVVFVAGSGPTDRDWCSPLLPGDNGSAKLLAEALAGQGFVTLRYDKIASGPHVRENIPKLIGKISMQSHLEELSGAVETICAEKNVDKNRIFVLTNSEGAIHGVNYQLQTKNNHFKGLVLTGAPGRAIGAVSRSQVLAQVQPLSNSEVMMKNYDNAIAAFNEGKPIPTEAGFPEGIKMLLLSLDSPVNLPFSKELWSYSLPDYLSKVDAPVLVVIGKKDIQVNWKDDGCQLEKATNQKTTVSFVYPENANHVLKYEGKPFEQLTAQEAMLNYNASGTELDVDAASTIYKWLKGQAES